MQQAIYRRDIPVHHLSTSLAIANVDVAAIVIAILWLRDVASIAIANYTLHQYIYS